MKKPKAKSPIKRLKKPQEKYKKSVSYYREKCIASFCKLVRLQQADEEGYCTCITCGKRVKWNKCDGGHFISRTVIPICIAEGNVNAQCKKDNAYYGGLPILYERKLREKIGDERVDWLLKIYFTTLGQLPYDDLTEDEKRLLDEKDKYYWIQKRKEFDKQIKEILDERGWNNLPEESEETEETEDVEEGDD